MRTVLLLIALCLFPCVAAASDGETSLQGEIYPRNIVPTFNHGYLAVYEQGGLAVFAPDGSLAARIEAPAGTSFVNADIDIDGSMAVAIEGNGDRGSLSIFGRDGSVIREILTGGYVPSQVCFAPDHSVWTLGSEDLRRDSTGNKTDYSLLRHYSRSGELLGEYFSRSSFPADVDPGQVSVGMWRLRIADGRLGVFLERAGTDKRNIWLEADLEGKELGRWTMPQGAFPSAMTDSGDVYVNGHGLWVLDRGSGSWKQLLQAERDVLLGAEGNTLVFAVRGMNRIRWAAQP